MFSSLFTADVFFTADYRDQILIFCSNSACKLAYSAARHSARYPNRVTQVGSAVKACFCFWSGIIGTRLKKSYNLCLTFKLFITFNLVVIMVIE